MSSHDYANCQDPACELCAAFSAVLGIMNTNPLPQDVVECLRTCAGLVCKDIRFKNLTLSTSMPTPEPERRDRRPLWHGRQRSRRATTRSARISDAPARRRANDNAKVSHRLSGLLLPGPFGFVTPVSTTAHTVRPWPWCWLRMRPT